MPDKLTKKKMQSSYKEREKVGGAFVVVNCENDKVMIDASTDIQGAINRFDFSKKTGSCVYLKLNEDWIKHGKEAFKLEVLETITKKPEQTDEDFKEDVEVLKNLWLEKMANRLTY